MSLGRRAPRRDPDGGLSSIDADDVEWVDAPWPTHSHWGCGYEFRADTDSWQVNQERIWVAQDGRTFQDRHLPPGAMLDGHWHVQKGADGLALVVVLPPAAEDTRGHWWHVDGPARGGHGEILGGWERTGDPRGVPATVAATPSILTSDYHGYLVVEDGRTVLTDHIG